MTDDQNDAASSSSSQSLTEETTSTRTQPPLFPHAPHLPLDLVAEILCKLPVKHLLQLRLVSISWNSLISHNPDFSAKHLRCSTSNRNRHHLILNSTLSSRHFILSHSPISSFFSSTSPITVTHFTISHSLDNGNTGRGRGVVTTCDGIICFVALSIKVSMDHETNTAKLSSSHWKSFYSFADKMKRFPGLMRRTIWKVGKDDPRKVVHSLKVGLALTLISLLYLADPLYKGIGKNAVVAVMTVVVVMEFTVGGTLSKGLNRGLGTLSAGLLAFFIEYLADAPGHIFRAVFIGAAVFILGAAATYIRFIPYIKKNYDYGVMIFLLTFNLIIVSSYRVDNVLSMAKDRISTICIGVALCLVMSLLVFPNWSGEDLHKSTISKLDGIANSIEVTVVEYFNDSEKQANEDDSSEDPIYKCYEAILDSKAKDETLAMQANWEPRYSRSCHRIPWQQYATVGASLRHFSYTVVALHGCLQSEIQTPRSIRNLYKDSCIKLAKEVSKVLRVMANSIRNKRQIPLERLSDNLSEALQDLDNALKSHPQLLLGSRNGRSQIPITPKTPKTPNLYMLDEDTRITLSSIKSDYCSPDGNKSKEHSREQTKEGQVHKKILRPQVSNNMTMSMITSLEFSEALPFAAFTSLLVEMVAKLGHVMDKVEELGKMSHFREIRDDDDEIIVTFERPNTNTAGNDLPSYGGAE